MYVHAMYMVQTKAVKAQTGFNQIISCMLMLLMVPWLPLGVRPDAIHLICQKHWSHGMNPKVLYIHVTNMYIRSTYIDILIHTWYMPYTNFVHRCLYLNTSISLYPDVCSWLYLYDTLVPGWQLNPYHSTSTASTRVLASQWAAVTLQQQMACVAATCMR